MTHLPAFSLSSFLKPLYSVASRLLPPAVPPTIILAVLLFPLFRPDCPIAVTAAVPAGIVIPSEAAAASLEIPALSEMDDASSDAPALPEMDDTASDAPALPTILDAFIASNNLSNPAYAIDNDIIILSFTAAAPCHPHIANTCPEKEEASSSPFRQADCSLSHTDNDSRHWVLRWRICNGDLPDGTEITACGLLDLLFPDGYQYNGTNPFITYLAPIQYTYKVVSLDTDGYVLLQLVSNHHIQLLNPEIYQEGGETYWCASVIDRGGNGPCCITIPLEEGDILLYNLTNSADTIYAPSSVHMNEKTGGTICWKKPSASQ